MRDLLLGLVSAVVIEDEDLQLMRPGQSYWRLHYELERRLWAQPGINLWLKTTRRFYLSGIFGNLEGNSGVSVRIKESNTLVAGDWLGVDVVGEKDSVLLLAAGHARTLDLTDGTISLLKTRSPFRKFLDREIARISGGERGDSSPVRSGSAI